MAVILDTNGNYFAENLPGQVVRKALETKALLTKKGAVYVGEGATESVTVAGESYAIPKTKAVVPLFAVPENQFLTWYNDGSGFDLRYVRFSDVTVGRATNDANGANITATYATKAALKDETDARTQDLADTVNNIKGGQIVAAQAKNVSETINGHNISNIFENNGTTVKLATRASTSGTADSALAASGDLNTRIANIETNYATQTYVDDAIEAVKNIDDALVSFGGRAGALHVYRQVNFVYFTINTGSFTADEARTYFAKGLTMATLPTNYRPSSEIFNLVCLIYITTTSEFRYVRYNIQTDGALVVEDISVYSPLWNTPSQRAYGDVGFQIT